MILNTAYAVIGSGYGDEGKGLMTDFLVRQLKSLRHNPIVVRGNGGAQAGHTVQTPDGQRHVFGHIGSGYFAGADTYLAENFIVNPYAFTMESKKLNFTGKVYAHPNCKVTTNHDMLLNILRELSRGNNRHGSCGLGINETVTRHQAGYHIFASDLIAELPNYGLEVKMKNIYHNWWKPQLDELLKNCTITSEMQDMIDVFLHPSFTFEADFLTETARNIVVVNPHELTYDCIVYEGAQGLALDEFLGEFPHVTRSITGLPSAIKAAAELNCNRVLPIYMTRSYTTRHGAGPLQFEGEDISDTELVDETNQPNAWQGTLRYAPLNIPQMAQLIKMDMVRSAEVAKLFGVEVDNPTIAITCMDQVGARVNVVRQHQHSFPDYVAEVDTNLLPEFVENVTGVHVGYISVGPTYKHVKKN